MVRRFFFSIMGKLTISLKSLCISLDCLDFFFLLLVGMEVDAVLDSGSEGESLAGTIFFLLQLCTVWFKY